MSAPVVVKLRFPVQAHGVPVSELTLRAVTGTDIRRLGLPFRIGKENEPMDVTTAVVATYVVELAAVPLSTVDALHPLDWISVMAAVMGFFGDPSALAGGSSGNTSNPGTSSTSTTTPPAGGGTIQASLG